MPSKVHSAQVIGLKPEIIDVEVDISKGFKAYSIVGLPDSAVKEAKDRISAAIKNSGFPSPQKGNKRTIVSLAPADIRKEGPIFDLAIAIGHLLAAKEIAFDASKKIFLGELALDGRLRPIKGALLISEKAPSFGFEEIYLPEANAKEAALIKGVKIFGCKSLREIASHLSDINPILPLKTTPFRSEIKQTEPEIDLAEVKGQETAKRGLEIAAAGGHNIAMSGPPGTGKSMLAKALIGILPPLSFDEALEATGIHSVAGTLEKEMVMHPPLRSPHHTSSYVSIVGGGAWPKPGEITLAHRGVLFLDEFAEFDRRVIEALRQPLEDRFISVARSRGFARFPASFILIATMNPCPCGRKGLKNKTCVCTPMALARYARKISGPIIDRIDLWLEVPQVDIEKLSRSENSAENSAKAAKRVLAAREIQKDRFKKEKSILLNSQMGTKQLKKFAPLGEKETAVLNNAANSLDLSARAYHRVIKIARTIADLAQKENIEESHLFEALQYRPR